MSQSGLPLLCGEEGFSFGGRSRGRMYQGGSVESDFYVSSFRGQTDGDTKHLVGNTAAAGH